MRKVLIITYYWPPAGGPGVQRWLKFVTYLKDYGIEPVVYIPENPTYPIVDKEMLKEIPKGIKIISQPIFEPYRFANKLGKGNSKTISKGIIPPKEKQSVTQRFLLWIRGNFFIPDARKFWVQPSVKYLQNYLLSDNINTIITTGPPHSVHLIGLQLKKKLSVQWISDFRDPWTTIGYHNKLKLTSWAKKKHKLLEKQVLQEADKIVVTSWGTQKEFEKISNTPIKVITNGFEANKEKQKVTLDTKFSISHIGSLLSERNPKNLWEVLSELIVENKKFEECFQLNLAGIVSEEIIETLSENGLQKHLNLLGYIPHEEALLLQKKSQVLLLIEIDSEYTKAIIPGKLFEYLQSERPILALGPKDADLAKIIGETQTGSFFEYKEKEAVKYYIKNCFQRYLNNTLKVEAKEIDKYSRKSLTADLAEFIKL